MANPEHLKILKQGVSVWNEWRTQNPNIKPDLRGVDLSEADLRGYILADALLNMANLSRARLFHADLNRADLRDANLKETDLMGAGLMETNLQGADLTHADLLGALLNNDKGTRPANLYKAVLAHVRFTGAKDTAVYPGSFLDLAAADGLETAQFSAEGFLPTYLQEAFEFVHESDRWELHKWPRFADEVRRRIRALLIIYDTDFPSEELLRITEGISVELFKYLKAHPRGMYELKPRQFEELIAEILASYGWQVQLTPTTRDGGYDIFAVSRDENMGVQTSWIIECKKYAEHNKVEVDVARALFGANALIGAANMMLATTSYFSRGVKELKASGWNLELRDYEGILEWINEYRPNPDGKLYIKDNRLRIGDEDK